MSIKSSFNKKNHVFEPVCNANVAHFVLNVNSELVCSTCNECMFDAIHDLCVVDYMNNMNERAKSRSAKSKKKKNQKPTSKVFTSVGYRWLPTGRTFTIDRTKCPMTRITSIPIVPLKETSQTPVITSNPEIKVYRRRTKIEKFVSLRSELSILGPRPSNNKEPNINWGSTVSNSPSSSRVHCRSSKSSFGKSKKYTHKPKSEDSNQEKLYLLHMDLCGPMRIESINEKKYILVIVDAYYQFTWVKFLRSKDETLEFTLKAYYEDVRISHQTSVARTQQQNGIDERQNLTLVEVARTMLIFSKALLFLWAEAVATACYTKNRPLIRKRHNKTPYELLHDKKPDLTYFHVFGALCYPTIDSEDLGKLKPKADIGIFVGYAAVKKAYRIYNKQTRLIMETIRSRLEFQLMTPGTISSRLVQNPSSPTPYVPPTKNDWDILFQPMFDEYFNPPKSVVSPLPTAAAPRPADPTGTPLSTSIEQDAPAASTSSIIQETQSPIISEGVEEQIQPTQFDNDPFLDILTSEPSSRKSSSNVLPTC
ncbi:retrovirus-related pol polyprotein from transposon TNT 1-94 [Tanacetum coccineum]